MKIFCIGRNYADHAKELGNTVPEDPVVFMKPRSALLSYNMPFYYPEFTNELHYECELVVCISKNGKYISEQAAPNYYDALSVGIDFTARDIQAELKKKGLPWEKAKAWDGSAVVGKWLPVQNFPNLNAINFGMYKNGELVQQGFSGNMIFKINYLISHISSYFSLNIGDLIYTGTPAGVGEIVVGDELEGLVEDESLFKITVR